MHTGFLQRLRRGLLLALLGAALPAGAGAENASAEDGQREQGGDAGSNQVSQLDSADQARYLAELKHLVGDL